MHDDILARIRARHGTVHRFCLAAGIGRSTVYQVLAGRYAGNTARQLRRIEAALANQMEAGRMAQVAEAIQAVACARCAAGPMRRCDACRELFLAQAQAVLEVMAQ